MVVVAAVRITGLFQVNIDYGVFNASVAQKRRYIEYVVALMLKLGRFPMPQTVIVDMRCSGIEKRELWDCLSVVAACYDSVV